MDIFVTILFYVAVVVSPVVFWFWFFRKLDEDDPEPVSLMKKIFCLGFLAILLAFFFEIFTDGFLGVNDLSERYAESGLPIFDKAFLLIALSFFIAGPIEELMKYLVLKRAIFKSPHFNQIADGIIYGTTIALGFSFFENTSYFLDLYDAIPREDFAVIMIVRGVTATLLHVSVTGIMGLYLGLEKFSEKGSRWLSIKGILIASFLHGIYNVIIFFPGGLGVNFFLVVFALGFLVYELRKKEVIKVWPLTEGDRNK